MRAKKQTKKQKPQKTKKKTKKTPNYIPLGFRLAASTSEERGRSGAACKSSDMPARELASCRPNSTFVSMVLFKRA
jgi:hypothetical protein